MAFRSKKGKAKTKTLPLSHRIRDGSSTKPGGGSEERILERVRQLQAEAADVHVHVDGDAEEAAAQRVFQRLLQQQQQLQQPDTFESNPSRPKKGGFRQRHGGGGGHHGGGGGHHGGHYGDYDYYDDYGTVNRRRSYQFNCLPSCLPTVGLGQCLPLGGCEYGGLNYGYGGFGFSYGRYVPPVVCNTGYGYGSGYGYGYGSGYGCSPSIAIAPCQAVCTPEACVIPTQSYI